MEQSRTFFTRDRHFYGELTRLTLFIALQNVIVCMVGLVDNIMVGNYSQQALTGVGIANQIQFLLQMCIGSIGEGMMVLNSQYWGTRTVAPIQRLIAIAMRFALIVSLVFMAVMLIFPVQVISLFTQDALAIEEGVKYVRIMAFTYVFFSLGNVLISAHRSVENVRVGMVASLCALVTNITLNTLLIFGHCGFPRMGVVGAAIATLIGRIVEMGVVLLYTLKIDKKLGMKIKDFFERDRQLFLDYIHVAIPVVLSGASWGIAMLLQTWILGRIDHEGTAIAANSIANTLFQVITVVCYGVASASSVVTGKAVGRDDIDIEGIRAHHAGDFSGHRAALFGSAVDPQEADFGILQHYSGSLRPVGQLYQRLVHYRHRHLLSVLLPDGHCTRRRQHQICLLQ